MLERVVSSGAMDYMERGIGAAVMRQGVIADNMANINTPKFKRSGVAFETLLARELYGEQPGDALPKLEMARTHDRHLPKAKTPFRAMPVIEQDNSTTMRVDQNNVDIGVEMASLAKNQIYDNALIAAMNQYVARLRNVITANQ